MESARSTWTDERLDDLSRVVESGFNRVDEDLRALGARIDEQGRHFGERVDAQSAELGARIDAQGAELSGRIDALQRLMIQVGATMTVMILITLLSVLLTRA